VSVGIIANPAAGKDIRRLVARASVFDNNEKVSILRRVLVGLDAASIEEAVIMPDYFGLGARAVEDLDLDLRIEILEMPMSFTPADTTLAATLMRDRGVSCIVTLGGDGTNRAVAKGCGSVIPLIPLSTGTNNVFPQMVEGTIAGLAAGVVARGVTNGPGAIKVAPKLEVIEQGEVLDIALVDAVMYADQFVGSRAIWDETKLLQIVTASSESATIGLSAVGSNLIAGQVGEEQGLVIEIGSGGRSVLAPIAPGLIRAVSVSSCRSLGPGEDVQVADGPGVLALDGERELVIRSGRRLHIRLNPDGPRVVDIPEAFRQAARRGFFEKSEVQEAETIARESADPAEEEASQGVPTTINR
jgi:predicted polyphosphate/ATP-dependent NAD kinase